MAMKNLFVEQAIKIASEGQAAMVDFLTEDNPIIANLPMEATNKGLQDVYEVLTQVDDIPLQELDAPITAVDAATRLEQTNLKQWGAEVEVGEDKLKVLGFGSFNEYFADKSPKIFQSTGNSLSRTIYYNSLRAYAIANNGDTNLPAELQGTRAVSAGGDTPDSQYSIVCVKWVPGEISGLYDPSGWGDGKVFDIENYNNGGLYKNSANVPVYGNRVKLNMGMKLANPRYVTTIVNIEDATVAALETAKLDEKLSKAIIDARGANAIYMHPALLQALGAAYKSDKLRFANPDRNVDTQVAFWDGVPIIADYNLDYGTEAVVTL